MTTLKLIVVREIIKVKVKLNAYSVSKQCHNLDGYIQYADTQIQTFGLKLVDDMKLSRRRYNFMQWFVVWIWNRYTLKSKVKKIYDYWFSYILQCETVIHNPKKYFERPGLD